MVLGVDIRVRVSVEPGFSPVWADRNQLEQVLLNLLINARDAMPEGGELRMSAASLKVDSPEGGRLGIQPGNYVRLEVQDTGLGISEEVKARIFEPFYTTKGIGSGTGLGLATVYGIVHQTKGAIEVDSRPGQGSCFRVFLPTAAVSEKAERVATPRAVGGDETVLVVEDEPAILELVCRTLRAEGYEIFSARDGLEAVALCRARGAEIDLVLSDVMMPGMHGPTLLGVLQPLCPKARFLLMSGFPDDALADRGVSHYLPKLFDPAGLRAAVRDSLESSLD